MTDSRTPVSGSRSPDEPQPRVQDTLKSALSKEVSAGPGRGAQFGDCTDAHFGDSAQFGDIAV